MATLFTVFELLVMAISAMVTAAIVAVPIGFVLVYILDDEGMVQPDPGKIITALVVAVIVLTGIGTFVSGWDDTYTKYADPEAYAETQKQEQIKLLNESEDYFQIIDLEGRIRILKDPTGVIYLRRETGQKGQNKSTLLLL